jgi:hypothetical protein
VTDGFIKAELSQLVREREREKERNKIFNTKEK